MFFYCFGCNNKQNQLQRIIEFLDNEVTQRALDEDEFVDVELLDEFDDPPLSSSEFCPDSKPASRLTLDSIAEIAKINKNLAKIILTTHPYFVLFSPTQISHILANKNYTKLATDLPHQAEILATIAADYQLRDIATISLKHPQFFLNFINHFNEQTLTNTGWYTTLSTHPCAIKDLDLFCELLKTHPKVFQEVNHSHLYLLKLLFADHYYGREYFYQLAKTYKELETSPEITAWRNEPGAMQNYRGKVFSIPRINTHPPKAQLTPLATTPLLNKHRLY